MRVLPLNQTQEARVRVMKERVRKVLGKHDAPCSTRVALWSASC